jgi:hypothetical protein
MYALFEDGGKYYHKAVSQDGAEFWVMNFSDWIYFSDWDQMIQAVEVDPQTKAPGRILRMRARGGLHKNGVEKVGDLVLTMVRA